MISRLVLLPVILCLSGSLDPVVAQALNWRSLAGLQYFFNSTAYVPTHAIFVDSSGQVYAGGYVLGLLDATQSSAGNYDAFVAKYDASGNQLWARQFGSPQADFVSTVVADPAGNVYVAGTTSGSLGGFTNAGATDMFISEFDSNGNQLWIQQAGSTAIDEAWGIAIDSSGNVNVVGSTYGSIVSGTTNAGGSDIFAVQYTQSGSQNWIVQFGSSGYEEPLAAAVDGNGNLYIAGYTSGVLPSGGTSGGGFDAFLAQYSSSGSQSWVQQLGSSGADSAYAVTVDGSGNVYVAGVAGGAMASSLSYQGDSDAFVAQYDSSGNQLWLQEFGTSSADVAYSVATDSQGSVYVSGTTYGSLAPGVANAGSGDVFSAVFDSTGTLHGVEQFGSAGWDCAVSLAFSGNSIYVAGYTTGSLFATQTGTLFLNTLTADLTMSASR
jgi:hypothetical protein